MAKKFPLHPKHPERNCWGCDRYCPVDSLACGNGSDRTQHPMELLGENWLEYGNWDIDTRIEPPRTTDHADKRAASNPETTGCSGIAGH
ncbi:MAG: DUF3079 domain-containing protein [Rhodocyclaceae bacterium]|jgi:hypothetical protein|nr:DUF3079 domain-containing protein [Rhodocyclaceae bacterium]